MRGSKSCFFTLQFAGYWKDRESGGSAGCMSGGVCGAREMRRWFEPHSRVENHALLFVTHSYEHWRATGIYMVLE